MSMSIRHFIHIHTERGWEMLGFNDDPAIAEELEETAKSAVESGEYFGHRVDDYRVIRADTSTWTMI